MLNSVLRILPMTLKSRHYNSILQMRKPGQSSLFKTIHLINGEAGIRTQAVQPQDLGSYPQCSPHNIYLDKKWLG